ncbi:glycerol-3-phosphate 1-O-acyltransferase PlsY [Fusibacter tunisiensis]|uniref:Glycerol-3-phosphate acyltransferase n=1 Tax=Fusibacter tunisiensis TaxID=1008308 RepID=A0ABS2MN31_9FIRM|nr:glycerol-3-phosphate 1-O-acyltransferase PlsY [Fusibacter tunisiensis]MBM7560732.1 glycerol-3-phosphate acyltransferase PlsY [Fusibacter tunisiensis]
MTFINYILIMTLGYLIGSVPFSYLIPKILGRIDIRQHGSGNTGTTNVVRTLGLKVGVLAFAGDFLKGLIPALIGNQLYGVTGGLIAGGFAVLGHCYSVWLGFNGGKGIATSAGVIAIVFPLIFPIILVFQFLVILTTRYMSLASIGSAIILPILTFFMYPAYVQIVFSFLLAIFVIYRHRSNLSRLISGTETKILNKK